jgi:hypothetical protein
MILWRPPAQIADRRLGIRNAEELGDAVTNEALHGSLFGGDGRPPVVSMILIVG